MIRQARLQDIPELMRLLRNAHAGSHYATQCGIDDVAAKGLLMQVIAGAWEGQTFAEVAEAAGTVEGFILGHTAPVYLIGDRQMATDLFWLASKRVDPRDPRRLMANMIAWARSRPDVIEIRCGATPVLQEPDKAGRMLKRLGLEPYGSFYRMEISP